ncbi:hypothetical protein [Paenibacillus flagellatus]|uniref:Uncharacterized protein n=1 Tax=Paenibacillus flagellatus TaxID=2211139 RepID=A0A2V5JVF8_9BACL|nr:hypothetical protein [Paenibacillus flagellatus]PYI50715.1 hypothetical protein DLM86_28525 [Paenibacillus flagellatus]
MTQAPIYFQYEDARAADIAIDTLSELGYHVHPFEQDGKPGLRLYVDHNDLTSALEIAQANGGTLLDTDCAPSEATSYDEAYGMDAVRIPAHLVNEDWPETYFDGGGPVPGTIGSADENGADPAMFDPSGDDYDHFSAGVRL